MSELVVIPQASNIKIPRMPSELDKAERRYWRRVIRDLSTYGAVTPIDSPLLVTYCQISARRDRAKAEVDRSGLVVRDAESGKLIVNPFLKILQADERTLIRVMKEIGISPASRARRDAGGGGHVVPIPLN